MDIEKRMHYRAKPVVVKEVKVKTLKEEPIILLNSFLIF
jgi:hypothetical protein